MRNIFDQFKHPENRLTHALACCLCHDRNLLKSFLVDFLKLSPPPIKNLSIIEQSLPDRFENDLIQTVDINSPNGLPDMIIFDKEGWCVFLESKIAAPRSKEQIKRHFTTLKKRGYLNAHAVVIAVGTIDDMPGCTVRTWSSVYKWIHRFCCDSFWAKELRKYFEILEKNMTEDEYLTTGTITDFVGIPFDEGTPFTYLEGKRILKLMMEKLKQRQLFDANLDVNYELKRGAITNHATIWDIVALNAAKKTKNFTDNPHFTLGLTENNLQIMFTLPDNILKGRLCSINDIEDALKNFIAKLDQLELASEYFTPKVKLNQRHYQSRRSNPTIDGILEFDLRTKFSCSSTSNLKVKSQSGWLESLYILCRAKSSNMQLQMGVHLCYKYLSKITPEQTLVLIENSCNAMSGLVSLMKDKLKNH